MANKGQLTPLREYSIRLGLSPTQVAAAIGVCDASLRNWESGKKSPSADNLLKLAHYYDVPVADLLDLFFPAGAS